MKYNFAIILSKEINDKCVSISRDLYVKNNGLFELGNDENFAHITVAHFECDDISNLENVVEQFEELLSQQNSFDLIQDGYRLNNGWLDVSFIISERLQKLYEGVLVLLDNNNCTKTSDDWKKNPPHITLTKFEGDTIFDINELPKYDFSFTISELGVFELGEYGTNKKLLKQFYIKKL